MVLDEQNPHTRHTRDGTVTKLDVNNRVHTDMWMCLSETGPDFMWQGQRVHKPVRRAALCRGGEAEVSQFEEVEHRIEWS